MYMAKHGDLITDGGVVWRVVDKRINGKIADTPNYYWRSELFSGDGSILTTPSKLAVNINGIGYIGGSVTINLNTAASYDASSQAMSMMAERAGQDLYIFVVETTDGSLKFLISSNSTVPYGYNAENSRKIGGFHCLCASTGTISGHALDGKYAGEILPNSIWDLLHRPVAGSEGMAYVEGIGLWVDIYLNSWNGLQLVSKVNQATADGTSTKKFHGELFVEELGKIGKRLPRRDEFIVFAKGSNEKTAINGATDPGITGAHIDSNSRRMVSNYGLEDCCGFLDQWTSDVDAYDGFSWSTSSVYASAVDSQEYGSAYVNLRRAYVGYNWGTSSHCGSRFVGFSDFSSLVNAGCGARGVSKPRVIE